MANTTNNNTVKPAKRHSAKWNSVVKALRAKYPEMSDKGIYVRARYACAK